MSGQFVIVRIYWKYALEPAQEQISPLWRQRHPHPSALAVDRGSPSVGLDFCAAGIDYVPVVSGQHRGVNLEK